LQSVQSLADKPDQTLQPQKGELELKGQFMPGSNYTFLVNVHHERAGTCRPFTNRPKASSRCGTSPTRPWPTAKWLLTWSARRWAGVSFPSPFCAQTVLTARFHPAIHRVRSQLSLLQLHDEDKARLKPVMLFDLLCNNADRKGSHVIIEEGTQTVADRPRALLP
jgi:hypothetical protein